MEKKKKYDKGPDGNIKNVINDELNGKPGSLKGLVDLSHNKCKDAWQIEIQRRKLGKEDRVPVWIKKSTLIYEEELRVLQEELLKMQNYVKAKGLKIIVIFEGRDASGKGGTIKRITEHLNQRGTRVVALDKPSDVEKEQWYFQRYVIHLPGPGEIVIFDRSWYNRAGVEPVMGYCTSDEHKDFLQEVPDFEKSLTKKGIIILKYYFSVSKKEQQKRFKEREDNPLKRHKLSPVDKEAQKKWNEYTMAKYSMLISTDTEHARWTIIRSDDKKKARLETIKHMLRNIPYKDLNKKKYRISKKKLKALLKADPKYRIHARIETTIMEKEIARLMKTRKVNKKRKGSKKRKK
ncbi:MAG: polyphosphate kinase 2 [Bacteroidales bacterium]|nr:polyphosphate kinase 2 [Bacteroidales bacterium]